VEKIKYLLSLPESDELVHMFLSSPSNDNLKWSAQLFEFVLENDFDAVAKSILQRGIDASQVKLEI
jgi:hypothetical protein